MMRGKRLRIWGAIAVALVVTISAAAMTATEAIKAAAGGDGGSSRRDDDPRRHRQEGAAVRRRGRSRPARAKIADHLTQAAELFPEGSDEGEVQDLGQAGDLDRPRALRRDLREHPPGGGRAAVCDGGRGVSARSRQARERLQELSRHVPPAQALRLSSRAKGIAAGLAIAAVAAVGDAVCPHRGPSERTSPAGL